MDIKEEVTALLKTLEEQDTAPGPIKEEEMNNIFFFPTADGEGISMYTEEGLRKAIDGETEPPTLRVVPSTPPPVWHYEGVLTAGFFVLVVLSCLMFQIALIVNPFIETVTVVTKAQEVTGQVTLQVTTGKAQGANQIPGRVIPPITLSVHNTANATGQGHQEPTQANGEITFYNGELQAVTIPSGTAITGADGVTVITNQPANIPAGNPPAYGSITVSAYAEQAGSSGNIASLDINQGIETSILAKNQYPFAGGKDSRNFIYVTKGNMQNAESGLGGTLETSMQGALANQSHPGESIINLPCSTSQSADHQVGEEAQSVTVTESKTCSGIAYNTSQLYQRATALLNQKVPVITKDFTLVGDPHFTMNKTVATQTMATLTLTTQETWAYVPSNTQQAIIKKALGGLTRDQATHYLLSFPGISQASVTGEYDKLPRDPRYIHLLFLIPAA